MTSNLIAFSQLLGNAKWAFIGAAGAAFVVGCHIRYSRGMPNVFDRLQVMKAYEYLEKFGLDYGSSMADNYFHGYLEIILPGLPGRVKEYKQKHEFPSDAVFPEKIFVIVHKSGYSPDTYEKENEERFWSRVKMEYELEGRSGIRKRKYQSSVYKVMSSDGKEQVTVVMEGAPCLRQLYESSRINKRNGGYDWLADEIIRLVKFDKRNYGL